MSAGLKSCMAGKSLTSPWPKAGNPAHKSDSKPASPDAIRFGNIISTLDLSSIGVPDLAQTVWTLNVRIVSDVAVASVE